MIIVIRMSLNQKNIFEVSHTSDKYTVSDTNNVTRTRIYRKRKHELSLLWPYLLTGFSGENQLLCFSNVRFPLKASGL